MSKDREAARPACHRRATCRLCASASLEQVLALAPTPPANAFVPSGKLGTAQDLFPLDVFFCKECTHVQLLDVVDPVALFEDYVYVSGTSPVFVRHFEAYAGAMHARVAPGPSSLAIDIGSNDGTLLRFFSARGMRTLGVDPARDIARAATASGVETLAEFMTPTLAVRIVEGYGNAAIVTANNVLAHADDLGAILDSVRTLLAPRGLFAFEVSYLADVIGKTLFDTIYHEHLDYHAVRPLVRFLDAHGLELIAAERVDSHGGSIRCIAQARGAGYPTEGSVAAALEIEQSLRLGEPQTYRAFGRRIDGVGRELKELLLRLKAEGKRIAGFGAPAKATTLMYQFGLGADLIDYIVDDSPLKQGLFTPGKHVPVVSSAMLNERRPDYVLVLAWNFASSIIARNDWLLRQGSHFIVPLPTVEIL